MKKAAFYTLGCKVNQYETEALTEMFEREGYQIVGFNDTADVYVINTCTVTNLGDRKSRQIIRRAKRTNKDGIVAVVGCYAQMKPGEILEMSHVNVVLGTRERHRLVEMVERAMDTGEKINGVEDTMETWEFEDMQIYGIRSRTRAYLKIQDGCNRYCSYCIIPYARGPLRSRNPESIMAEAERLAKNGFKEIVLTGIHIASYGKDKQGYDLLEVIRGVHQVEGIHRIRLSSVEPTLLTKGFVQQVSSLEKVCRHYHVSLQSGCDQTLKRMNRKYTTDEYRNFMNILREYIPGVSVTTDIITGFPGETEAEFEKTCGFIEEIGFSSMHVFKFSPREGTPAAGYPGQIRPEVKEKRSSRLMKLADKMKLEYMQGFMGASLDVLYEKASTYDKGFYEGHTDNYLNVMAESNKNLEGRIEKTGLMEIKDGFIIGILKGY